MKKTDDELILAYLEDASAPKFFANVQSYLRDSIPFDEFRRVDKALQRLRRAGKITYLKKKEGGPGWIALKKNVQS